MVPIRIQRQRTRGWRMPPNTVYVGRPSRWGNPFRIIKHSEHTWELTGPEGLVGIFTSEYVAQVNSLADFRRWLPMLGSLEPLRGKSLACWCPLSQACHADVLLEVANG